jgi:RNA polymerase sigma-70 factor (ECF subfamily)
LPRPNEWLWHALKTVRASAPTVFVLFDELDAGFDPRPAGRTGRGGLGAAAPPFLRGNSLGALWSYRGEAEAGDASRFLDRLRAGDAAVFEELVMTYQHRVFGVILRMLGSAAEAEEVAPEAFVRVHRALGDFRGDAKLTTWLTRSRPACA